jgi:hypothetical protein
MKTYLNDQKTEVNSTSGWNLLNIQVQNIAAGNAGNRASDDEIRDELAESNWEKEHIEEFIEFINSELIEEMAF